MTFYVKCALLLVWGQSSDLSNVAILKHLTFLPTPLSPLPPQTSASPPHPNLPVPDTYTHPHPMSYTWEVARVYFLLLSIPGFTLGTCFNFKFLGMVYV